MAHDARLTYAQVRKNAALCRRVGIPEKRQRAPALARRSVHSASVAYLCLAVHRRRDIRFVDVHRVAAYLSKYLAGDKIEHTLRLLPRRARIFTTARCIVLWGKKEKSGWRLRRVDMGVLFDAVENPTNVRFEAVEDLKPFRLKLLSYFESPPCAAAVGIRDVIKVLREAIPIWKAGTP